MKKMKCIVVSLGIIVAISFISTVPMARAASSTVWFDTSTELVWKYTKQALDESMQLLNSNITYRKLNFTEIIEGPDHLNISGGLYSATEADVIAYGYNDSGIWDFDGLILDPEMYDNDLTTKFASLFNEQNVNLTQIETLSASDQTMILMAMGFVLDDILFAVTFVYILAQGFGATFGYNYNSSTITDVTERNIVYNLEIDFSFDSSGHWQNASVNSDLNLTYGVTSNVLLHSEVTSEGSSTEWNGTEYVTEYITGRYIHDIISPESLLSDFPEPEPEPQPEPKIPGFSISILSYSILIGVCSIWLIMKRQKKI